LSVGGGWIDDRRGVKESKGNDFNALDAHAYRISLPFVGRAFRDLRTVIENLSASHPQPTNPPFNLTHQVQALGAPCARIGGAGEAGVEALLEAFRVGGDRAGAVADAGAELGVVAGGDGGGGGVGGFVDGLEEKHGMLVEDFSESGGWERGRETCLWSGGGQGHAQAGAGRGGACSCAGAHGGEGNAGCTLCGRSGDGGRLHGDGDGADATPMTVPCEDWGASEGGDYCQWGSCDNCACADREKRYLRD